MKQDKLLWKVDYKNIVPSYMTNVEQIIPYSNPSNLTVRQQQNIIKAYENQAYDMAVEYVWKKAITNLREHILELGEEFVGELIQRPDVGAKIGLESVLTDYNVIQIAEQLGMISHAGALDLRQSFEVIQFYFSSEAVKEEAEFEALRVASIIKSCVVNILSQPNMEIAVDFTNFRSRLFDENIPAKDPQLLQLISSSLFIIRTVITILASSIRTKDGAILEHSLNNFKVILPLVWGKISSDDKWRVGALYKDVMSDGDMGSAVLIKSALAQVAGFDYVPESLRSNTFIEVAQKLIDVHYEFDNYYKEPRVIKELASLGTIFPKPAMPRCIKALLLVYMGNLYGRSTGAVPIAEEQLSRLSQDDWMDFLENVLPYDDQLIGALCSAGRQREHFIELLKSNNLMKTELLDKNANGLFQNIINGYTAKIRHYWMHM